MNQAAAGSQALTVTATATASGASTTQTVAPPDTAAGATLSPALAGTPSSKPRTATALTADHDPVDTDRWCSVPRNDTAEQALQPTPNQVEWAVDMAVRGDLTSGWITQGGWRAQTGLGTINPQGLFPKPTLTGGGSIPAQVELGILAQESNLWQAESGAIPGQMGNPLAATAGFYGHTGTAPADYWKIDWTHSDCGYGVGQITDGMRLAGHEKPGETSLSPTIQKAVALDYTVNVAASLKILADKWTEVHTTGQTVTVNNDDASKPENWFTAVWNYNLGFNKPAGAPGVSWGLGWYNNPANPIYPASRLAFMDTSLDPGANHDAAHPQDWPYEEKVMGWAAWSIDTGHSYATTGRQDWPGESGFSSAGFQPSWWLTTQMRSDIKPPLNTFCNTLNACDVNNPPPAKPTTSTAATNSTGGTPRTRPGRSTAPTPAATRASNTSPCAPNQAAAPASSTAPPTAPRRPGPRQSWWTPFRTAPRPGATAAPPPPKAPSSSPSTPTATANTRPKATCTRSAAATRATSGTPTTATPPPSAATPDP